jgi:uncharacterized protein YyaL (SSP411 family)
MKSAVAWLPWGADAFARARAERKPILLAVTTTWCEACAHADRTTFADETILRFARERVVPIRVDGERRPDINDRYNMGGWPTVALLTPGGAILTGGTSLEPPAVRELIDRACREYAARGDELDRRAEMLAAAVEDSSSTREPDLNAPEWFRALVRDEFDAQYGGFGSGPRFPHTAALAFVLEEVAARRDDALRVIAERTLEAIAAHLLDPAAGGFFRYAERADWSVRHPEKLLEDNAALLRLFAEAAAVLHDDRWREVADRTARFLVETLARPEGGFSASEYPDCAAGRRRTVDPAICADANAQAIVACLRAADVLDDRALAQHAIDALERVMLLTYHPGTGVTHGWVDGAALSGGLLVDQVRMADALIWAHQATDRLPYSMLAAELMRFAIRTMWSPIAGGFFDRSADPSHADQHGLLRRREMPAVMNVEAARVLERLAVLTDDETFHIRALETLASQAPRYRNDGLLAAPYALAIREVVERRMPLGLSLSYVDWRLNERDED